MKSTLNKGGVRRERKQKYLFENQKEVVLLPQGVGKSAHLNFLNFTPACWSLFTDLRKTECEVSIRALLLPSES